MKTPNLNSNDINTLMAFAKPEQKKLICPNCDKDINSLGDLDTDRFCDCGYELQESDIMWIFIAPEKTSVVLKLLKKFKFID